MVSIIVAYNGKFVIGNNMGKVPWHIPEDLKFFKEVTMGCPCVMGRKTWESIPEKYKPLPGRPNYIVSRDVSKVELDETWNEHVVVYPSVERAIEEAQTAYPDKEVFITGGGEIYRYCIVNNLVDRVLASEIKNYIDVEGSTSFPDLKSLGWNGGLFKEFEEFTVIEYLRP